MRSDRLLMVGLLLLGGWAAVAQVVPERVSSPVGSVIALPGGGRLVGLVTGELDQWPGVDLILLTTEPWPEGASSSTPTIHVRKSDTFAVLRFYSGRGDGRFHLGAGGVLPLYLEMETRAYREGGQILLEPKWPIGIRVPEQLMVYGNVAVVTGYGWPLDRTRSAAAGGENPVIGFSVPAIGGVWYTPRLLNEQRFLLDRDVRQLLLSQVDPLYGIIRAGRESRALLVLEREMSTVGETQAYALRVYHDTTEGLVEVQRLAVGERGVVPSVLAIGDLNEDGYEDVVIGFSGPLVDRLTVLMNCGDGTLRPPPGTTRVSERDVRAILIADFDNSGKADLVVVGPRQSLLLLGDGRGGFAKGGSLDVGLLDGVGAGAVTTGYFNDDNKLDLAMAQGTKLLVLLGEAGGSFRKGLEVDLRRMTGSSAFVVTHVAAAEVNGRRGTDLVVGSGPTGEVAILVNDGLGNFAVVREPQLGPGPALATAADVNKDGVDDLVMVYPATRQLAIEPRGRSATTAPVASGSLGYTASGTSPMRVNLSLSEIVAPSDLVVADVDGNGTLDAAVTCRLLDVVLVIYDLEQLLRGDPRGPSPRTETVRVGRAPSGLLVMQLPGKPPSIVVSCPGSGSLYLLQYDTTSRRMRASPPAGIAVESCTTCPIALAESEADLDGDGIPDVVVGYREARRIVWFPGRTELRSVSSVDAVLGAPWFLAAADVNADRVPDLVVAEELEKKWQLRILHGAREPVCCGSGAVTYKVSLGGTLLLKGEPVGMVVRDIDGDSTVDIAVALSAEPWIQVWRGLGKGGFEEILEPRWVAWTGEEALKRPLTGLVLAVDRTGQQTRCTLIGFSEQVDERVIIQPNPDPANGETRPEDRPPQSLAALAAGDFDGDGVHELGLLTPPAPTGERWRLAVLRAPRGRSETWTQTEVPVTVVSGFGRTTLMEATDLNGDQKHDLLVLDVANNRLVILWGPTFADQEVLGGLGPGEAALAAGGSAGAAWILAGSTILFRRASSARWAWGRLELSGAIPLRAWSCSACGGQVPDLVVLAYYVNENRWAIACYDGARIVQGDLTPRELRSLHIRTEVERSALAALRTYYGNGNPSIVLERGGALHSMSMREDPLGVTVADVNVDGDLDLVVLRSSGVRSRLSVVYGGMAGGRSGTGELGDPFIPCAPAGQMWIASADLDGNGRPDVVVFSADSGCLAVVYNGEGSTGTYVAGTLKIVQMQRRF